MQNLGKVVLMPKGAYNATTVYNKLDVVTYNGSSYACTKNDIKGVIPTDGDTWKLLASKGDKGDKGDQGIQGIQGPKGDKGDKGDPTESINDTLTDSTHTWSSEKIADENKVIKHKDASTDSISSSDGSIRDLQIYGKVEQASTSGKNLFDASTIYAMTFIYENGVFINKSTDGRTVFNFNVYLEDASFKRLANIATQFIDTNGVISATLNLKNIDKTEISYLRIKHNGSSKDLAVTIPFKTNADYITVSLNVLGTDPSTIGGLSFTDVMVYEGSEELPYEPYTGGIPSPSPDYPQEIHSVVNPKMEVTNENETQSATLNGITLNAIPVSSGGNVTIDGQQYISDYVDIERGVVVRNVNDIVAKDETWRLYTNIRIRRFGIYDPVRFLLDDDTAMLSSHFSQITYKDSIDLSMWFQRGYIVITDAEKWANVEELTSWLEANDVHFYIQKPTPIEEELTAEQLEQFKALRTYYGTTNATVTSDDLDGASTFNYYNNTEIAQEFSNIDDNSQIDDKLVSSIGSKAISNSADGNIRSLHMLGNSRKSRNLLPKHASGSPSHPIKLSSGTYSLTMFLNGVKDTASRWGGDYQLNFCSAESKDYYIPRILNGGTFTITDEQAQNITAFIVYYTGAYTPSNSTVMLNEGSTALPYEPYGLILSDGVVESNSKNLLDIPSQDISPSSYINLLPLDIPIGTYTFSYDIDTSDEYSWAFKDKNKNNIASGGNIYAGDITFTASVPIKYLTFYSKSKSKLSNIMLEKGSKATDYVPYAHSSINASEILNTDFIGVNDIHDELIVNADGSGKFIKRVGKVDDLFSLDWYANGGSSGSYEYAVAITDKANGIINMLSNRFKVSSTAELYAIRGRAARNTISMMTDLSTVSEFKTYIQNSKLYYVLATPTETDLTPQQVSALLSLKTFRDKTLITSDCEYEIGYFADSNIGQSLADINALVWNLLKGQEEPTTEPLAEDTEE